MSRADLIRSLGAPAEQVAADLIDQLADASAALARLRARTPDEYDSAWSRQYTQAQNHYLKALSALEKLRKATPSTRIITPVSPIALPAPTVPNATTAPTEPAAPTVPVSSPAQPPLNRQARRKLAAFQRASPERRRQFVATWSKRANPSSPPASLPSVAPSPAPA